MKKLIFLAALTAAAWAGPLKGWELSSPSPSNYTWGQDTTIFHSGRASGYLQSVGESGQQFAVLTQKILAQNYMKRQICLSGFVKSEDVKGWCALWLRIDSPNGPSEFDNMEKRPIRGTTPWTKYEIKLDVPREAHTIHFGVLLQGSGQVWVDDINLTALGEALPASKLRGKVRGLDLEPVNPGFEDLK